VVRMSEQQRVLDFIEWMISFTEWLLIWFVISAVNLALYHFVWKRRKDSNAIQIDQKKEKR